MGSNTPDLAAIKAEVNNNDAVTHCAERYGDIGDPTSMKMCYLPRHHAGLSVSQLASLDGVSVPAAPRCLKRRNCSEEDMLPAVVAARRDGQAVCYSLEENNFTTALVGQLKGDAV